MLLWEYEKQKCWGTSAKWEVNFILNFKSKPKAILASLPYRTSSMVEGVCLAETHVLHLHTEPLWERKWFSKPLSQHALYESWRLLVTATCYKSYCIVMQPARVSLGQVDSPVSRTACIRIHQTEHLLLKNLKPTKHFHCGYRLPVEQPGPPDLPMGGRALSFP